MVAKAHVCMLSYSLILLFSILNSSGRCSSTKKKSRRRAVILKNCCCLDHLLVSSKKSSGQAPVSDISILFIKTAVDKDAAPKCLWKVLILKKQPRAFLRKKTAAAQITFQEKLKQIQDKMQLLKSPSYSLKRL